MQHPPPLMMLFATAQCLKGIHKPNLMLMFVLLLMLPFPAHATEYGGEGIMAGSACVKPKSKMVATLCIDYKISWKLWTLMGEPVGDYKLKWILQSLTLAGGSGLSTGTTYEAQSIPAGIAKEVKKIELSFDGKSSVAIEGAILGYHAFNTGVATQAGKTSMNSPGSPNWNKMFISATDAPLTGKEAKQIFRESDVPSKPLMLDNFVITKNSVFNLRDLENKISMLCIKSGQNKPLQSCLR